MEPRERTGSLTARQYDYQYEQTAYAALEMLASQQRICVYVEWHDDFVIELSPTTTGCYHFHQVKTKRSSQGPWSFRELFGVTLPKRKSGRKTTGPSPKSSPVDLTAVVPRMLHHYSVFGANCGALSFVTNTGLEPRVESFLTAVKHVQRAEDLPDDERALFSRLCDAYLASNVLPAATAAELLSCLQRFGVLHDQGHLANEDAALLMLGDRISEYSEIALTTADAKVIARQLVQLVHRKATDGMLRIPVDDETLRARKGIVITEILNILSLSIEGYQALLSAGADKNLVRTLSRLQRYCQRVESLKPFISSMCMFKAKWDAWRTVERHRIDESDYVALEKKARDLLASNPSLEDMAHAAKDIAVQFSKTLPAGVGLTGDHVLGLVFSLAADSEALL